ncbi:MAG: hypothetical protein ACI4PR_02185 [Acutalibacteraceae bacterium]
MIKNLKKHSKLLLLALLFSASSIFPTLAVEPQQPGKPETTQTYQAQKRKREDVSEETPQEKRQRKIQDDVNFIRENYKIEEIMGPFAINEKTDSILLPRCGLSACNRSVRKFYLILPESNKSEILSIGNNTCIGHLGNFSIQTEKKEIIQEILSYFFDINNWGFSGSNKNNVVIDLKNLLENEKCNKYIRGDDRLLTIFFNSTPIKKNLYQYNIAYNGKFKNGIATFKSLKSAKKSEEISLKDKLEGRMFEAFCFFCTTNGIL